MMKPLYIASFLVAVTLTYGLYTMKYEVQRLEARLASLHIQLAAERESIQVLRAEWSYLNNPERLETLASRHLHLVPVSVHRTGALARLPLKEGPAPAGKQEGSTPSRASKTFWKIPQGAKKAGR